MRVTPVSFKSYRGLSSQKIENQHVKQNSPSFGNFESPDIEDELNSVVPYKDVFDEKRINYLKNTPFATVKKGQDEQGKTMLYAVMNKDATDKHKNKEFFDSMLEKCKELVEIGALSYLDIIETGIPEKEPYFIGPIANRIDLATVYADLEDAEEGYVLELGCSNNTGNTYQKQDDDLWLEAVSREILN